MSGKGKNGKKMLTSKNDDKGDLSFSGRYRTRAGFIKLFNGNVDGATATTSGTGKALRNQSDNTIKVNKEKTDGVKKNSEFWRYTGQVHYLQKDLIYGHRTRKYYDHC